MSNQDTKNKYYHKERQVLASATTTATKKKTEEGPQWHPQKSLGDNKHYLVNVWETNHKGNIKNRIKINSRDILLAQRK